MTKLEMMYILQAGLTTCVHQKSQILSQKNPDRSFKTDTNKICTNKHKIDIKTLQKHRYNITPIFRRIFFPRNYTVVHLFLINNIDHFRATVKSLKYSVHPAWLQTLIRRDL